MLTHLQGFDFGRHVFVDFFHMFELGVVKKQLELTFKSMTESRFALLAKRMERHELSSKVPFFTTSREEPFKGPLRGAEMVCAMCACLECCALGINVCRLFSFANCALGSSSREILWMDQFFKRWRPSSR
jgi:hypothetical protein